MAPPRKKVISSRGRKQPTIRISHVITRSGDDGFTGLVGGRRVPKDDPRIEACGACDELQVALAQCRDALGDALGITEGQCPATSAALPFLQLLQRHLLPRRSFQAIHECVARAE